MLAEDQTGVNNTSCTNKYKTTDKLYLGYAGGKGSDQLICYFGANNDLQVGLKGNGPENGAGVNPYVNNSKGGYFWLRSPYTSSSDDALGASTGDCVGDDGVDGSNRCVPACALNLESVIFASAAAPAAELQSSSALSDDGVYFRFENPSTGAKISTTATTSGNTLTINKGSEGGDIYLYVQGNNDDSNDWVYSKKLTQSETIEPSTIHSGSTSLENCKVWAETTVDNVTYATNPVDGTSSITQVKVVWPKATVTAPTAKTGLTYNGTAQELVSAGTATNGTMQYSLTSGSGFSTDITTATDAGTYTVYYKAVGTNGYKESDEGNVSVIIGKKALTVTADNQTVTYGSAAPAYTVTYNGFENNETSSVLSGTLAFACSYTTSSNAGTYDITPSGLTSSNYDITFTKGTLTVSKADINPTVTLADWTVGGTASTPSVSGNTGNGGVTYKYKAQGADDSTYSTTVPTKAGSYTVKAEVPATTNYNAGEATADFVVKQKMYVTLKNEYGGAITNVDGITLSVGGTALTYVGNGVFSTEGLTVGNHNLTVTVDGSGSSYLAPDVTTYTINNDAAHPSSAEQPCRVVIKLKQVVVKTGRVITGVGGDAGYEYDRTTGKTVFYCNPAKGYKVDKIEKDENGVVKYVSFKML